MCLNSPLRIDWKGHVMTKLINERVLRVTSSMIIVIRHMSKGTEYILKEGSNTNGVLFRRKREVRDYIGAGI